VISAEQLPLSRFHLLQVMRFDVQSTPPVNPPFDVAKLNAALRSDFNKAPTTLPPAATVQRQVRLLLLQLQTVHSHRWYYAFNDRDSDCFLSCAHAQTPPSIHSLP
jgi:hypothetical protein